MNSSSGSRLEKFFSGKGFYIVLFLCAAVIGVSLFMMATETETVEKQLLEPSKNLERSVGRPLTPPPQTADEPAAPSAEPLETPAVAPVDSMEASQSVQAAVSFYVWPVSGEICRGHSGETLSYDETMRDWRTHNGIDIAAPLGEEVLAAHSGTVQSVRQDGLMGTVVVIDHGDGSRAVYANLEESVAVSAGDYVEAGTVIGAVGGTALGEVAQTSHLHFALEVAGHSADPTDYLPA